MRPVLVALLCAATFAAGVVAADLPGQKPPAAEPLAIVTQDGKRHLFTVEIVDTPEEMAKGLMFREKMDADHGMLFETGRPPKPVAFWMKNTLIPLDMIFVGESGTIMHIAENAVPRSLASVPSVHPVIGVVEINGGLSARLGLKAGDRVEHGYFQGP